MKITASTQQTFRLEIADHFWLRPLREDDAPALFALTDSCRDYLARWLPEMATVHAVDDSRLFIRWTTRQFEDGGGVHCGIWYRGETVGVIGLTHINRRDRRAEIGYWLGERFQGHGIMTRAVETITGHAIETLRINRVVIRAASDNVRSRAIAERLGYTFEGLSQEDSWLYGDDSEYAVYAMLARDWAARSSASTA